MKRLSIAVILFITVFGSSYASPIFGTEEPNFVGADHFLRQFPQATNINYKVKGQFTEVNFMWNGLKLQAYYDREGTPLATTRTIDRVNLPVNVLLNLQNQYPDGVVTSAIEYTDTNDGLSYYVTLTKPKYTYLLHVSTSGDCSVFKKMKN
ncbi:hypothetical protein [Puia sp.]|jgi:hypothetical protein|uniref:hypothetical protein n=1 Tax=Puia sp. TaxID=2045100 RepID=UPI002F3EACF4